MSTAVKKNLSPAAANVSWMLEHFVDKTAGVRQAIGVSSDGLLMALAADLDRGTADKLAATVSGLTTLAVSAARLTDLGPLSQVITECAEGYLVATLIKGRACLGVITEKDCDLGLVAYESALMVQRIGEVLTPELISELKASLDL